MPELWTLAEPSLGQWWHLLDMTLKHGKKSNGNADNCNMWRATSYENVDILSFVITWRRSLEIEFGAIYSEPRKSQTQFLDYYEASFHGDNEKIIASLSCNAWSSIIAAFATTACRGKREIYILTEGTEQYIPCKKGTGLYKLSTSRSRDCLLD